jgi:hypothetical protein
MVNKQKILLLASAFIALCLQAQTMPSAGANEQTGFMRSEAKIYVVMIVTITILLGLIVYLLRLDRKISRLEKGGNM